MLWRRLKDTCVLKRSKRIPQLDFCVSTPYHNSIAKQSLTALSLFIPNSAVPSLPILDFDDRQPSDNPSTINVSLLASYLTLIHIKTSALSNSEITIAN